ncbi:MAG: preprotein translocase subunit SecY [Clostridia bacterium]|nr:preprotein translocase subunit SecY [Oscillospiraceae bacterium]MBQ7032789.1 preprotein translocase subunit SecY [Clostridia bacterium]
MFKILKNAWAIPELRKKILYTLLLLVVFRFGSVITVPWLDSATLASWVDQGGNTLFSIMDMFSGGAFSQATIFAMGVSPYINSSIIIQLLTVAIPALERLSKEGEEGRKKISKITRYVTVVLAFVQAAGLYIGLNSANAVSNPGALTFFVIALSFTAGTAFLMWLGEEITEKGIGNGISMIIFAGIVAGIPTMAKSVWQTFVGGGNNYLAVAIILVCAVLIIGLVVLFNNGERRIPVQYAKRVVGRKMYGGQSTHIPIKVTMAGVMPIIFAMSLLAFPSTVVSLVAPNATGGFAGWILKFFNQSNPWYAVIYFVLIVGFTYFYTSISFSPIEVANNMKKNGGFIPGIRPGKSTSDFIAKVLSRITLVGAFFLGFIAILPIILALIDSRLSTISIGGTSLLIVVGVALETVKQIESQMLMRHYKGFLE